MVGEGGGGMECGLCGAWVDWDIGVTFSKARNFISQENLDVQRRKELMPGSWGHACHHHQEG